MAKNDHFKTALVGNLRPGDLIKVSIPGVEFLPAITRKTTNMKLFEEPIEYLGVFKKWRYIFDVQGPIEDKQGFCDTWVDVPCNADRIQMLMQVQGGTREFPLIQAPTIKYYQLTVKLYKLLYF